MTAPGRPPADAEQLLREALRVHHPIMRSETGPFSGCRCGGVKLGQDVIAHVVDQLLPVVRQAQADELEAAADRLVGESGRFSPLSGFAAKFRDRAAALAAADDNEGGITRG